MPKFLNGNKYQTDPGHPVVTTDNLVVVEDPASINGVDLSNGSGGLWSGRPCVIASGGRSDVHMSVNNIGVNDATVQIEISTDGVNWSAVPYSSGSSATEAPCPAGEITTFDLESFAPAHRCVIRSTTPGSPTEVLVTMQA